MSFMSFFCLSPSPLSAQQVKNHHGCLSPTATRFGVLRVAAMLMITTTTTTINAQESPNPLYQAASFEQGVNFRQDVCDREAAFARGEYESLGKALRGLELRAMVGINDFFQLDNSGASDATGGSNNESETSGTIYTDYPGIIVTLMDEIARRGEFTWRNSFAVVDESQSLPDDKDWTEFLIWQTDTYDMAVSYWFETVERKRRGINFVDSWMDGSLILVAPKDDSTSQEFDAFLWLKPFDSAVWYLLLATVVASGFVYWLLEMIDPRSDKSRFRRPAKAVYLSFITFTGHFDDFQPNTTASQLFAVSLAFFALLSSSAYTANLASFLVVQGQPKVPLESVEQAVRQQLPLCVFAGAAPELAVRNAYPNAILVQHQTEREVFQGILDGDCAAAVTGKSVWDFYQGDDDVNGECTLGWVGRTFRPMGSTFATKSDSGTKCTNLIWDVVNLHLSAMKSDGFVDEAWEQYLRQTATVDCMFQEAQKAQESAEHGQLGLENMSGIFLCFYIAMGIAIVWAFIETRYKRWRDAKETDPDHGSVTRNTTTAHDDGFPTESKLAMDAALNADDMSVDSLDGDAFDQVKFLRREIRRMNREHEQEIAKVTQNIQSQLAVLQVQLLTELKAYDTNEVDDTPDVDVISVEELGPPIVVVENVEESESVGDAPSETIDEMENNDDHDERNEHHSESSMSKDIIREVPGFREFEEEGRKEL